MHNACVIALVALLSTAAIDPGVASRERQSGPPAAAVIPETAGAHTPAHAPDAPTDVRWQQISIADPYVRDAVGRALDGASERLSRPKCQLLLSEFRDARGRTLSDRLAETRLTLAEYLQAVIVQDGETHARCAQHGVLAFTTVGRRVVYVCGRTFARAWQKDASEAHATLIHELLHPLGLGENPPSPRDISYRVRQLCW